MTATQDVTLDLNEGLEAEEITILDDFVDAPPSGAWPKGWYSARIIEGFQTKKGKVIQTADDISKKGDSRNLTLCLAVKNGKDERNMIHSLNYRTSDFGAERQLFIAELRKEHEGVTGRWSDTDAQRTNLSLVKVKALTKSVGFSPKMTTEGGLVAGVYVGQQVDVYLGVDEKGFNEVKNLAPSGTKTGGKPNGHAPAQKA